jgi:hypothetical protein
MTPQPQQPDPGQGARCPTCGSDDPKNFNGVCGDRYLETGSKSAADPFHSPAQEGDAVEERREAVLEWKCEMCGATWLVPMPGYPGDGYKHYVNGQRPCGPLTALRAPGFLRARPGEILDALNSKPTPDHA